MFECPSAAVGRQGKSFSGCRCVDELVRLYAPQKKGPVGLMKKAFFP